MLARVAPSSVSTPLPSEKRKITMIIILLSIFMAVVVFVFKCAHCTQIKPLNDTERTYHIMEMLYVLQLNYIFSWTQLSSSEILFIPFYAWFVCSIMSDYHRP